MKPTGNNLIGICKNLSDLQFHTATEIGSSLKISCTAIWKAIKKLQDNYDVDIDFIKGKGYRLKNPLKLIDAKKLHSNLKTKPINIEVYESIDSTNNYLCNIETIPKVIIAEYQIQGRGNLGKSWYSPFAENIICSIYYSFKNNFCDLGAISLVVGILICESLEKICGLKGLQLKWPNDVVYNNQKLAGILIKVKSELNGSTSLVIGLGINVNMHHISVDINQLWTSIIKLKKQYIDRNIIYPVLIDHIIEGLKNYQKYGFKCFIDRWGKRDALMGKNIKFNDQDAFEGVGGGGECA